MSAVELLMRLPKATPPRPTSVVYERGALTLWQIKNCSPPAAYFGFKATAAEFRARERNPTISFTIGEQGRVDEARLLLSSGSLNLDSRILTWFWQLHFAPTEGCAIAWKGNGLINVEFGSGSR